MRTHAGRNTKSSGAGRIPVTALCLIALVAAWAPAQQPDLHVLYVDASGVTGNWQTLLVDGPVSAEVGNMGAGSLPGVDGFQVLFFEDVNGNDTFDAGTDTVLANIRDTSSSPGPGQSVTVDASLGGRVRFRGCRIHAFVDYWNEYAEENENNNIGSSDPLCTAPLASMINTTVEWSWTTSTVAPTSNIVLSNPAVCDMNGDGIPDIVFSTCVAPSSWYTLPSTGILRCISGNGSGEIFSVDVAGQYVRPKVQIAVGDIDGDGLPEILTGWANPASNNAPNVIAFEHDGTFKWTSPLLEDFSAGGPSIANLDGIGNPEIIVGRQVLDSSGNLLWTGTGGTWVYPMSLVADVNLDGTPEIVCGSKIYSSTGAILHDASLGEGVNAVANFDADSFPEIVLVKNGSVWLLEHDATVKWGPADVGSGTTAPLVADLDGDGEPEIGVASSRGYTVFEADGSVKWFRDFYMGSSTNRTATAFDLDGDGAMEVLFRTGSTVEIMRGADGAEAGPDITGMGSMDTPDYPIVADVDNDGQAEIVLGLGNSITGGIRVIGDSGTGWVSTRKIWNQWTYHVTNVNDDGTIPLVEQNSWQWPVAGPYNAYRQNQLANPLINQMAPDLVTSRLLFGTGGASATVRVGNGGAINVPSGMSVSFYDGDPSSSGLLLGTSVTTTVLQPGAFEDVTLTLAAPPATGAMIYAVADDSGGLTGTVGECNENNNVYSHPYDTCPAATWYNYGSAYSGGTGYFPDLTLSANPVFGSTININAENTGATAVGWLIAGLEPLSFKDQLRGALLVNPIGWHAMMMPPGFTQIPITIPTSLPDCGLDLYAQLIFVTTSTSYGPYAFSKGLHMILGP